MLVRKSDAVCALPDGKGYICDAVNARHPLGNSAVGDFIEPVAPTAPAVRLPILIGGDIGKTDRQPISAILLTFSHECLMLQAINTPARSANNCLKPLHA